MKSLEQLTIEVAEFLGVEPLEIEFDNIDDDSRLCIKEEKIIINEKYKGDFLECAKCITHEMRHVFQLFYVELFDDDTSRRWKKELAVAVNSSNINDDGSNYFTKEIEIDAFAFTKYYLEHHYNIKAPSKISGLDMILDAYIDKNYL